MRAKKRLFVMPFLLAAAIFSGCYTQIAIDDYSHRHKKDQYYQQEEYYESDSDYVQSDTTYSGSDTYITNNYYGDYYRPFNPFYRRYFWGYHPTFSMSFCWDCPVDYWYYDYYDWYFSPSIYRHYYSPGWYNVWPHGGHAYSGWSVYKYRPNDYTRLRENDGMRGGGRSRSGISNGLGRSSFDNSLRSPSRTSPSGRGVGAPGLRETGRERGGKIRPEAYPPVRGNNDNQRPKKQAVVEEERPRVEKPRPPERRQDVDVPRPPVRRENNVPQEHKKVESEERRDNEPKQEAKPEKRKDMPENLMPAPSQQKRQEERRREESRARQSDERYQGSSNRGSSEGRSFSRPSNPAPTYTAPPSRGSDRQSSGSRSDDSRGRRRD